MYTETLKETSSFFTKVTRHEIHVILFSLVPVFSSSRSYFVISSWTSRLVGFAPEHCINLSEMKTNLVFDAINSKSQTINIGETLLYSWNCDWEPNYLAPQQISLHYSHHDSLLETENVLYSIVTKIYTISRSIGKMRVILWTIAANVTSIANCKFLLWQNDPYFACCFWLFKSWKGIVFLSIVLNWHLYCPHILINVWKVFFDGKGDKLLYIRYVKLTLHKQRTF